LSQEGSGYAEEDRSDPAVKERALRLVREHQHQYSSTTAAAQAVARQLGLGKETVRRSVVQADVDASAREGVSSGEREEIRALKAENARLREDVAILRGEGQVSRIIFAEQPSRSRCKTHISSVAHRPLNQTGPGMPAVARGCCTSPAVGRICL